MKSNRAKFSVREGDTIVETEVLTTVQSAIVDYADILAACEIVVDDDYDPFDCDGLEHTLTPADSDDSERYGYCWDSGNRRNVVITIDPAQVKSWGVYDYARAGGASKQVAREMEALNLRSTIDTIRKWIAGDSCGYGVTVDFLGEHDSCYGYDDYEFANHEARHEHALNIASALEARGYTVENKPATMQTAYARKWNARRKLGSQSWVDYEPFNYAKAEREFARG